MYRHKNIVQVSQELDKVINQFERGEITKGELEIKRLELYIVMSRQKEKDAMSA